MVCPVVGIIQRDGNQALPIPLRTGNQRPPRPVRVAGLEASAALIPPEQLVVIGEGAPCHRDGTGTHDLCQRFVLHHHPGQGSHVGGGGVVPLVVEPVWVFKVGVLHAQLGGLVIHPGHKSVHVPGAEARNGHRRVIARGEQQPVEQRLQRQLLPRLQIHGGALHSGPLGPDGDYLGQIRVRFHRHQRGHQLGNAGNGALLLRVLGIKDPAAFPIDQDGGGSRDAGPGGPDGGTEQNSQCQKDGGKPFQTASPQGIDAASMRVSPGIYPCPAASR